MHIAGTVGDTQTKFDVQIQDVISDQSKQALLGGGLAEW